MSASTILCATDLGLEGKRAVDLAAAFARALSGRVVLLHTAPAADADTSAVPESMAAGKDALEAVLRERHQEAERLLEAERARCESLGVESCEALLRDGRPAEIVEAEAERLGASLVVLSRKPRGKAKHAGPTVHRVVRRVSCPVVVAPPAADAPSRLDRSRWVVGMDLSRESENAFAAARRLVDACGGEIVLVNVAFPVGDPNLTYAQRSPQDILRAESIKEQARRVSAIAEAAGPNVTAVQRMAHGSTAEALMEVADEIGAVGIIVGTHGRTGLGRFFVGSTAEELLAHAPCPVLVVREPAKKEAAWFSASELPLGPLSASHALVAVDFSDPSRRALEAARDLATKLSIGVDVVYVHEPPTDVRRGLLSRIGKNEPPEPTDDDRAMMKKAKEQLDLLVRDVFGPNATGVDTVVEIGRPGERILRTAAARNADLVIVGTTGRSGLTHILLGSAAEHLVRHSRVPVLTVH